MYTVPVIPPDLRHEETIIQAANALDCLQKVINSVFDRIDSRTQRNNAKVEELSERIERAQAKIRGLVGTKKAIQIYAPARFPATRVFRDIPQTFATVDEKPTAESLGIMEQGAQPAAYEVQSRVDAPVPQSLQEKLLFFHVRSKEAGNGGGATKTAMNQCHQNMGAVPEQLRSVSSLLCFNSDELVYGDESAEKEAWKRARLYKGQRLRGNEAQADFAARKQLLEPAPYSLANRNQKVTSLGGLRYTPRLHNAPEINLPLDLPDLPGIADDIHFEGKEQQQIAPSLYIENLPDLLELELKQECAAQDVQKTAPFNKAGIGNIPKTDVIIALQVPPPPPPVPLAANITVAMAPPPPPPPPPPPAPSQLTSMHAQTPARNEKSNFESADTTDAHSELMDAIRKAGGTRGGRLRAAAAAPVDVVENRVGAGGRNSGSNKTKPGNLMDDLHNKLIMRRKGISGAKDNETLDQLATGKTSLLKNAGNPVMSRLSALIPPPPNKGRHSDDDDDTVDEDNDTDWAE